jgi:hypothetical protein
MWHDNTSAARPARRGKPPLFPIIPPGATASPGGLSAEEEDSSPLVVVASEVTSFSEASFLFPLPPSGSVGRTCLRGSTGFGIENQYALMPYCGVHDLLFVFVWLLMRSHPPLFPCTHIVYPPSTFDFLGCHDLLLYLIPCPSPPSLLVEAPSLRPPPLRWPSLVYARQPACRPSSPSPQCFGLRA